MLVSVIICTHNSRLQYLRRALSALRAQTLPVDQWELLIIDNASDQPLTAGDCNLSWHARARIVREAKLGIAVARLRGMQEADAEILVFVDDDNVLASDYLMHAVSIGKRYPMLGVWGSGSINPEFEIQPPRELVPYLPMLGIRDVSNPLWSNVSYSAVMPWGAGQCLRPQIALAYRERFAKSKIKINGQNSRDSRPLHAGEDVEIGYVACECGLGVGVFPELKLTQLIPKERLNEDHLIRFREDLAVSTTLLEYTWRYRVMPNPLGDLLGVLRVVRNVLRRNGLQRRLYLADVRGQLRARALILEHARENS
jgi:glycosyltransferase involved in cell wall biosynthesis